MFGFLEIFVVLLVLLVMAIVVWVMVTVTTQQRRIAHLEHRLDALERRGPA